MISFWDYRKFISVVILLSVNFQLTSAQVKVNGYYRSNGTYVQPHYRSSPDGNPYNNYSFPGNINPYTLERAQGNRNTYLTNYYNSQSESIKKKKIKSAAMHYANACIYLENGSIEKALESFGFSSNINPLNPEVYHKRAEIYLQTEKFISAKKEIEKCIYLDSTNSRYYFLLSFSNYKLGENSDALKNVEKSINLSSSEIEPKILQGFILMETEDYDLAVKCFSQAIKLGSRESLIFENRGVCYYNLGLFNEAILDFNFVLDRSSDFHLLINRGLTYIELEEFELALRDFNRAIDIDSSNIYALLKRAFVKFKLKQYENSLIDCNRVIELDNKETFAYVYKSMIYFNYGDEINTIKNIDFAANIEPDNLIILKLLGSYRMKYGLNYCETFNSLCELGVCDYFEKHCK